jgi:isocitrate dehydrogenase
MLDKISMKTPLVEIDGDEMTRVMWDMIKNILIKPYVDLKTQYYDLGLEERDNTDDQVTVDAANAIKKYGVGVKCATITPNAARVKEYNLKQMWKSPNGTLRGILDGTVFRTPIIVNNIKPYIPTWTKPITIARHAYGDIYKNVEMSIDKPGKVELVYTSESGEVSKELVHQFDIKGVVMGMHNLDKSIESFAKACFTYALDQKIDLWFSAKETISKKYDRRFMDIFEEIYETEYKKEFKEKGLTYFYSLIDDTVARIVRSEGGMLWACKNYDGDVMSDLIATAYGSLAMMTSVLVSPEGYYEYEAAHGTVQKHYAKYKNDEETSTNSMATIFAWTGALKKRGEIDNTEELVDFADRLEKAAVRTIEDGVMTRDLFLLSSFAKKEVNTEEFLTSIKERLD